MIHAAARRCPLAAGVVACSLVFVCLPAVAEPYIGQFELKTLESAPRSFEFQSQNAWSWGNPSRQIASGADGLEFDENAVIHERYALELEAGLTNMLKMRVGVEFERERLDEPATIDQANASDGLSLTEFGAELIAVLVPREASGTGLGVVVELEGPLDQEDPNHLVLGGIIEFQSGRWFLAAVPMFVHAFGGDTDDGERRDAKWDFTYAAQLLFSFSEHWALALEGYGTLERLGRTGHPSDAARLLGDFDQHRLGPVLYYTRDLGASRRSKPSTTQSTLLAGSGEGTTLSIGVGLLEGLNDATADHTLKLSIEVDF